MCISTAYYQFFSVAFEVQIIFQVNFRHTIINEPVHEISNNVVCATSKVSDQPAHTQYSMIVKLLTEHHMEFLSLKRGRRDSSESTHVKKPHCNVGNLMHWLNFGMPIQLAIYFADYPHPVSSEFYKSDDALGAYKNTLYCSALQA